MIMFSQTRRIAKTLDDKAKKMQIAQGKRIPIVCVVGLGSGGGS